MIRPAALLAAPLLALALGGCGGIKAADLFIVTRTSTTPPTRLTLLIDEEGGVQCNGGPVLKISDPELVEARAIQEESSESAGKHLYLPPRPGSVFSYLLREESGTVRFSDNSAHTPAILHQLALLVLQVGQQVCHLPQ